MLLKWVYVGSAIAVGVALLKYQTHEIKKIKYNHYDIDCVICSEDTLKKICPEYGWVVRNKYMTGITISCKDAWGHVNSAGKGS